MCTEDASWPDSKEIWPHQLAQSVKLIKDVTTIDIEGLHTYVREHGLSNEE